MGFELGFTLIVVKLKENTTWKSNRIQRVNQNHKPVEVNIISMKGMVPKVLCHVH